MPHRIASPLEAGAAGDSPTPPASDRSDAPDRRSHRHRPARARETALCATPVAIAPPTKAARAPIIPVLGAAPGHRQRSNPHRSRRRARPPRVPCMGPWLSSTYFTAGPTSFRVSWFDLEARFFVPTHRSRTLARAGAVKIGRRSSLSPSSVAARPHLYGLEHAGMLVGGRDDAVEGSSPLAARRASHHNLVFGGPRDPNHDAVLRIGRETPKWRAHSSLRHCSHRTSAGCPPPRTVIGALLPRTPNS